MEEKKIKQTVEIKDIVFEEELYPRTNYNWQTGYDYSTSIEVGAKFPPIVLALLNKRLYLVDGKHRIEAYKLLKRKEIDAEVYTGWDKAKIFEEAVKRNIAHGRVLSPYEKRTIALRLRKLEYSDEQIGNLIQIPLGRLEKFIGTRLINTLTGEAIIKSEIKHLAGQDYEGDLNETQKYMYSSSQVSILSDIIMLIENNLLDKKNKNVVILLEKLKSLL